MAFLHKISSFFFFKLDNLTFRKTISVNEQWPDSVELLHFQGPPIVHTGSPSH